MTSELLIDGLIFLFSGGAASYLWWRGLGERILGQRGYLMVTSGMSLVFMGVALDLVDNFPNVSRYVFTNPPVYADYLRWYVGFALGGLLILLGFVYWVPTVVGLRNAERALREEAAERLAAEESLRLLRLKLLEVQESERRAIARELHDELGQDLTGLKLSLEAGVARDQPGMRTSLEDAAAVAADLTGKLRDLSQSLRPSVLDDMGLLPALNWQIGRFGSQSRLKVKLDHSGLDRRLDPAIETAVYRIVQEGLTNVARHAGSHEASVAVSAADSVVEVRIEDRGVGFELDAPGAESSAVGLSGMRERVELLRGNLVVDSSPGEGTRLVARLPLDTSSTPHE